MRAVDGKQRIYLEWPNLAISSEACVLPKQILNSSYATTKMQLGQQVLNTLIIFSILIFVETYLLGNWPCGQLSMSLAPCTSSWKMPLEDHS